MVSKPRPAQPSTTALRVIIFNLGTDVERSQRFASPTTSLSSASIGRSISNVVRLRDGATDYIGAARRDPDGKAVRIALSRKVTMNSMQAGDQLYVDLLPDTWTGLPPGLPREVIEALARKARDADKKLRAEQPAEERKVPLVRVRVANQPTFTRYVFPLPEPTSVAADNRKDRLTLTFNGMLNFDLSDAKANLPSTLQALDSELDQDTSLVRFVYQGRVDVRTFREENNYVVDIGSADVKLGRGQRRQARRARCDRCRVGGEDAAAARRRDAAGDRAGANRRERGRGQRRR